MKKIYFIGALLATSLSFGQVILNENFNYTLPGNIGGNSGVTTPLDGVAVNNWVTHSNTSGNTGTIDLATGSLSYTGLLAPTGNKILLPGSNTTVPRDVNRAITTTATTIYASFLLNVTDNTQLTAAISGNNNYFFSIGQTAGINIPGLGARVAITSSNAGGNFRLHISNNTGGTPTYTENAVDLNFAQTYLVVIKFDRAAAPTAASLWVNPASLGGTEPVGSVSNTSGTGTFTAFSSAVLRNASGTPKAEIDELRIGATWADVTPVPLGVAENNISGLKIYPNPAKTNLFVTSNNFEAKQVEIFNVLGKSVLSTTVTNAPVNVSALSNGVYMVKVTEEGKTATRKLVIE